MNWYASGRVRSGASFARRVSMQWRTGHLRLLLYAVATSVLLALAGQCIPATYSNRVVSLGSEAADIVSVDSTGLVGRYTSIAIDSGRSVHISYYDSNNGDLKYATNAAGGWDLSTIDSHGTVGWSTSIAVDAADNVHISYKDSTNSDLKYATNIGGSWAVGAVDCEGDVGSSTSIVVDSGGWVHISYYDSTNGDLKYATNAGGEWVLDTVDSEGDVGGVTSIAVDSNDIVHISYSDITKGDLKYATNAGGTWTSSAIDDACDVSSSTSIAVDSADMIHISYYDSTNDDLKYATNASGTWSVDIVDDVGNVGAFNSMAIDWTCKAHISYYDTTCRDLKYATNGGGGWELSAVDSYDDVGWHTSIAVDRTGRVHISYYDFAYARLKYATFSAFSVFELSGIMAGWNLVSIPLVDHGYMASTLPGLSSGDMVSRWDSSTQTYDKSYIVGISDSGSDFAIEPSWSYWVGSGTAKSVEFFGREPAELQTRTVEVPYGGGWVQVGLASLQTTWWASDLVDMYTADLLTMVSRWNSDTQTYSSYIVEFDTGDFQLNPGDGLWLYVEGSGVLSYAP